MMNTRYKNQCIIKLNVFSFVLLLLIFSAAACNNNNYPVPPPKESAWKNKEIYTDASQKITADAGKVFIIGFSEDNDMFPIVKQVYDNNMIELIDKQSVLADAENQRTGYSWFLFKALKNGETQITIQHFTHITVALHNQEIFTVVIN